MSPYQTVFFGRRSSSIRVLFSSELRCSIASFLVKNSTSAALIRMWNVFWSDGRFASSITHQSRKLYPLRYVCKTLGMIYPTLKQWIYKGKIATIKNARWASPHTVALATE